MIFLTIKIKYVSFNSHQINYNLFVVDLFLVRCLLLVGATVELLPPAAAAPAPVDDCRFFNR